MTKIELFMIGLLVGVGLMFATKFLPTNKKFVWKDEELHCGICWYHFDKCPACQNKVVNSSDFVDSNLPFLINY
jgi:hypothetical protein